jgi:hypothetical protein
MVITEYGPAGNTPNNDVMDGTRGVDAGLAWHIHR